MTCAPIVTFLIAGVQKAGTTALYDYLAEEPGVGLSRVKETHFFDDDSLDWSQPDYGRYHGGFDAGDKRVIGEATPIYSYWPNSLERIRAYNPAMRLILLLRDPVARAWSHWRMEFARGVERGSFGWCIRQGRQRLFEQGPVGRPWGHDRELSYVERGFYGEQVERLYGLFPAAQVLILKSEDLRRDPAAALAQVRAFLGLPEGAPPRPREVHVGAEMDYPSPFTDDDRAFLRGVYARDQARLRALTGISFAAP